MRFLFPIRSVEGHCAPRTRSSICRLIGRILCLCILPAAVVLSGCNGGEAAEQGAEAGASGSNSGLAFTDVTEQAGLGDFRHVTGAFGETWFPESMGSGGGFIDYNGDGWADILLVGGGVWPQSPQKLERVLSLYRNNGDGTFTLQSQEAGLDRLDTYGIGIGVGDYDNDGDEDFYFSTIGENQLFRNDNGVFTEVGKTAGVAGDWAWSSSAAFFDADRDGWLDLYVGNYVKWTPETDLYCSLDSKNKGYCTPEAYEGLPGRFYHNNGDGTFSDRTQEAGFLPAPGKSLGVTEFDFNRDGWPDLIVTNDTQPNLLYKNNGDGSFTEIGAVSGVAYDEHGKARAGMGVDAGVVDSTGEETIVVGNFSKEMIGVWRHIGNDLFIDRAAVSRIGRTSLMTLTFGVFLFDVDLDGDLDFFAANGHVQPQVETTQQGISYAEAPHLFINPGDGTFEDKAPETGGVLLKNIVARGSAYADYDRDGDLDVLITENDGPVHLWRNDLNNGAHFLRVYTKGVESNRDGIGTQLVAYANGLRQMRRIRTAVSYLSASEKAATFGLGAATRLDSLVVYWPSGLVERFSDVRGDQEILLEEGAGEIRPFPKRVETAGW